MGKRRLTVICFATDMDQSVLESMDQSVLESMLAELSIAVQYDQSPWVLLAGAVLTSALPVLPSACPASSLNALPCRICPAPQPCPDPAY